MQMVRASVKNIPLIVKMKIEMFRELNLNTLLEDDVEEKMNQTYQTLYQEDKLCHFILYENDQMIAIGGATIKEDIPFCFFKTPYYGYILDIYCIPEKRRNGYATEVMRYLLKWLEEKGVHNVKLKPSQMGSKLYEQMRFELSNEMEKWI